MFYSEQEMRAIQQDSRYADIGALPSQGIPYKGRAEKPELIRLLARPFELVDLQLLSKSIATNSIRYLLQAVDKVITHDVYDLTIGDFFYILLWLRIYSRPQIPYNISWECNLPYFTNKETNKVLLYDQEFPDAATLAQYYSVDVCGRKNIQPTNKKDITIKELPIDLEPLPEGFDFPRVNILENIEKQLENPEFSALVAGIQWIAGNSWEEKVKTAENNPLLVYDGFQLNANETLNHGVSETVHLQCTKCKAKTTHKLTLNALTFFQ